LIKNIIFDLGNVLIDFHPKKYLSNRGLADEELDFVYREIFLSDEWVELDRGTITRDQAFKRITARNPDKGNILIDYSDFENILVPIKSNIDIFSELSNRGYKTYYLTNYHAEAFEYAYNNFDFIKCFDGGLVSADVKLIKPDPRIYNTLQTNYKLVPEESLFIDDTLENVEAASKLGFQIVHLKNQKDLRELLNVY